MSKGKLQKFEEMKHFPNVYQMDGLEGQVISQGEAISSLEGKWNKKVFNNHHPITLELACGKGEYTLELAQKYPEKNFIGIDIKGARQYTGASMALECKVENAVFLRTRIEMIENYFDPGEVSEIWITFPDPFLKKENRRLTAPVFLDRYRRISKVETPIHLKTDSIELFEYTVEVFESYHQVELISAVEDIYSRQMKPEWQIQTFYEKMHLEKGKQIYYVQGILKV